jgi:hypothetical protein
MYIYTHKHTYIHIHAHTYTNVCVHDECIVDRDAQTYARGRQGCTDVRARARERTHARARAHTHTHTHVKFIIDVLPAPKCACTYQ